MLHSSRRAALQKTSSPTLTVQRATWFTCTSSSIHSQFSLVTRLVRDNVSNPCPTSESFFPVIEARDAWLAADRARFNGANVCTISAAFASRGLGAGAGAQFVDDFTVEPGC